MDETNRHLDRIRLRRGKLSIAVQFKKQMSISLTMLNYPSERFQGIQTTCNRENSSFPVVSFKSYFNHNLMRIIKTSTIFSFRRDIFRNCLLLQRSPITILRLSRWENLFLDTSASFRDMTELDKKKDCNRFKRIKERQAGRRRTLKK